MDEDGAVKVDVQVAEELWETYTDPAKDTLRIKYDPFDDRNWVLPAAAVGPGISKLMTVAITILGGPSLGEPPPASDLPSNSRRRGSTGSSPGCVCQPLLSRFSHRWRAVPQWRWGQS